MNQNLLDKQWTCSRSSNSNTLANCTTRETAETEIAQEHKYKPTSQDWAKMKEIYDKVDTNGDGSVSPEELEAAIGGHDH